MQKIRLFKAEKLQKAKTYFKVVLPLAATIMVASFYGCAQNRHLQKEEPKTKTEQTITQQPVAKQDSVWKKVFLFSHSKYITNPDVLRNLLLDNVKDEYGNPLDSTFKVAYVGVKNRTKINIELVKTINAILDNEKLDFNTSWERLIYIPIYPNLEVVTSATDCLYYGTINGKPIILKSVTVPTEENNIREIKYNFYKMEKVPKK